jgi:hypothetical protein
MDPISGVDPSDTLGLQVAILTQKKAMQAEQQAAQSLIEALPQQSAPVNPPHLGQSVDTTA